MFFYGGKDTTYFNTLCGNRKNFFAIRPIFSYTRARTHVPVLK